MKIPEGYKKTGLGILPKDWEVVRLGEVCELKRGKSITAEQIKEGIIPVIAGGREPAYYHNEANRTGKTIVVAGSGAYAGYVSFWDNPIFVSDAFSVIPIDCKKALIKIIFYYLQNIQHDIYDTQKGTGTPHVYPSSIEKFQVPLPPLAEQEKIAEILSTWDTQIQNLESLIQEKQNLKKGLYQILLTAKTRFKGFYKSWNECKIKKLCLVKKGQQLNKLSLAPGGKFPVINGGILPSGYTDRFNTQANTITISEGGNSCGFINYIKENFWSGGHCYTLHNLQIFDLFFFFSLKHCERKIQQLRVGSGLPNIQKGDLEEFIIKFPDEEEQKKIAEILSGADDEITLLAQKLESLKTQKKGLMQQLLSGKIRVKI